MASSSSRTHAPPRPRAKRFSRAQLEHNLQIVMSVVSRPMLPPTLPSPPTTPPAPPHGKRKAPPDGAPAAAEQAKRARTSLQHADVHQDPDSAAAAAAAAAAAPSTAPTAAAPATAPTPGGPDPPAFPHRRGRPSAADFTRFYERFSAHGKHLKYSAEVRGQQLAKAAPEGGAYAAHALLFSRLEALDALLSFAYAMWCMDMADNKCHHAMWDTIDLYQQWVRRGWETRETQGDAPRAFIGVIRMVEAYIYARKATFMNNANAKRFGELDKVVKPPASDAAASISPATSLGGSSQHSVPNASPGAGPSPMATPAASRPAPPTSASAPGPSAPPPTGVLIPRDLYESLQAAHNCTNRSARAQAQAGLYLNVSVLARNFPRTNARVIGSQLRPDEEYEVDFEQDECARAAGLPGMGLGAGDPSPGPGEGQLVWPGPLNSGGGEGVAWVCLLGRAMIRELAYPLGYRGLDGILRKDAPPPR